MNYGHSNINVSRYTNNSNIAVVLDEGRYDILTTNGEMILNDELIGIRNDEFNKVSFAYESELITTIEPAYSEPSGFIFINYYPVTNKLKRMIEEHDEQLLSEVQDDTFF